MWFENHEKYLPGLMMIFAWCDTCFFSLTKSNCLYGIWWQRWPIHIRKLLQQDIDRQPPCEAPYEILASRVILFQGKHSFVVLLLVFCKYKLENQFFYRHWGWLQVTFSCKSWWLGKLNRQQITFLRLFWLGAMSASVKGGILGFLPTCLQNIS